jgi:TolB protein
MNTRSSLTSTLAVILVVGACTGRPVTSETNAPPSGLPTPSDALETRNPDRSNSLSGGLSGRIVFDNHDDVWTINVDGTRLTQLTDSPAYEFDPSWSPDGARIAFRTERSGETEIWLMNADGTDQHRLTAGLSPAWSPDGSLIAFAGPSGTTGIITLVRPDGTGLRQLPHTEGGEYPTWSPDGTRLAFNSNLSGDHVMYVANADGSNVVDLSAVGEGWQVDWSPDGHFILFTSHRDNTGGYTDVYVMTPDGSDVRRLTRQLAYTPAWSPDGEHIVFSAPGLFFMNADGTGVTPIPTNVGETSLPDWTE